MTPVQLIVQALIDIPRWTWRGLVGLVLVLLAYVVPRLVAVSAGVGDILDTGALVGAALIATEVARARAQLPPGTTIASDQRGHARGSLLVALLAIGLAAIGAMLLVSSAGCALLGPREVVAEQSVDFDVQRGPPCIVKVLADGDLVQTTTGPNRCRITVDGEPERPPAPEPAPTPQS